MLIGFKERFVEPIQKGTKIFTMRNKRKVEPVIGETLHMYTGLRTKHCMLISKDHTLKCTQRVFITIRRTADLSLVITVNVDYRILSNEEIDQFVKYDGFVDREDFAEYWIKSSFKKSMKGKPVRLVGKLFLHHWTNFKY